MKFCILLVIISALVFSASARPYHEPLLNELGATGVKHRPREEAGNRNAQEVVNLFDSIMREVQTQNLLKLFRDNKEAIEQESDGDFWKDLARTIFPKILEKILSG